MFPPLLRSHKVLCADGNPKRLIFEIDPVLAVEFDRARVHLFQPFDRQRNERIGIFKIIIRGLIQLAKPVFKPLRFARKVHIHFAPVHDRFPIYQEIDKGRAVNFSYVEGPLVAL